jgi:nitroreductase
MNFQELLDQTRTYHNFTKTTFDEKFVESLIENALKAPNHKFTFPWQYLWVREATKEKMADLFLESKKHKINEDLGMDEEFFKKKILNPEVLVMVQNLSEDEFTRKEDYATMACSVQIMALMLREHNYSYKWSTGGLTRDAKLYQLLGLDSSKEEIIGILFMGITNGSINERRRPKLESVLKTIT